MADGFSVCLLVYINLPSQSLINAAKLLYLDVSSNAFTGNQQSVFVNPAVCCAGLNPCASCSHSCSSAWAPGCCFNCVCVPCHALSCDEAVSFQRNGKVVARLRLLIPWGSLSLNPAWTLPTAGPLPELPTTLEVLLASDNQLSGTLPASLSSSDQLRTLRASRNRLGGRIPYSKWWASYLDVSQQVKDMSSFIIQAGTERCHEISRVSQHASCFVFSIDQRSPGGGKGMTLMARQSAAHDLRCYNMHCSSTS
jgi:hypothetical protein